MLSQIQKQEQVDNAKDERSRKRQQNREERAEKTAQDSQRKSTRAAAAGLDEDKTLVSPKRTNKSDRPAKLKKESSTGKLTDWLKKEDLHKKGAKDVSVKEALEEEIVENEDSGVKSSGIGVQNLRSARQPDLVSGGIMRGYQLEGLEWLTSLYENGLNGILADEMGLGKTIQTISFLAFLREKGTHGPFLVAAPLSTTTNWVDEFKRWTPDIPVVLYHGSKQEREEIRKKRLRNPGGKDFPVVCTSYEICMNDRKFLAHLGWKFIIIDEGHRIKNMNCRLIRELQSYQSANRLLITGTPLQNNLSELWSLLHFLMPDIFDKLESFESWFDFSALKEKNGYEQILSEERRTQLVASLHAILKPFLLRRVKADVEHAMPKKREYVLYAPLSTEQHELYQHILSGSSRGYLEEKVFETLSRAGSGANTPNLKSRASSLKRRAASTEESATPNKSAKTSRASTPATNGSARSRGRKVKKSKNYSELNDRAYFKQLEQGSDAMSVDTEENESDAAEIQRAKTFALAKKQIAHKKLQNPIMQLRLCCNSPHNFYYPFAEEDDEADTADYNVLVTASGKMRLLDQLLRALLSAKADHKILLFSQFKTQLDILALYIEQTLALPVCRIDGSIPATERADQIRSFNNSKTHRIFLLSTRAGGQGINLAAADTVILFDSDWNPQQDLQAQDRAHRIGQRRNVVVYRLATRGTVEEMLLEKADGKRRLEKLVIRKGRFRSWTDQAEGSKKGGDEEDDEEEEDEMAELRGLLGKSDGERFDFAASEGKDILTKRDLKILIDRSDEAYERAEQGQDLGNAFKAVETTTGGDGLLESLAK